MANSSRSGKKGLISGRTIIFVVVTCIVCFAWWSSKADDAGASAKSSSNQDWKSFNGADPPIPPEVKDLNVTDVQIKEQRKGIMGVEVFYRKCKPGFLKPPTEKTVLLLHGHDDDSSVWEKETHTLSSLAAMGHTAIAIDMPGHGKTDKADKVDPAKFLEKVIHDICKKSKPIVVSPSTSAKYSVKLLKEKQDLFCGFVPVAPIVELKEDALAKVGVPTMPVRGEKDEQGKGTDRMLSHIRTSTQVQVIPHGSHPCYLDNPEKWNTFMINFLDKLSC